MEFVMRWPRTARRTDHIRDANGTSTGILCSNAVGVLPTGHLRRLGRAGGSTDLRVGADPTAYGKAIDEQIAFLRAGIGGLFTDQADIGVLARQLA
jgi:glycerophosphoryl diester phosphodiesterase